MGTVRKRGDRYFLDFYDQRNQRQRHLLSKGTTKAQEAACRLENTVFGVVGHHLGTKKEKGSRSKTATP